jgi:YVTN family beta-propeller protein
VAALGSQVNPTISRFGTLTIFAAIAAAAVKSQIERLPQQWTITPAGKQVALMGDFPSRIIENKDGTRLYVLTSGYHHQGLSIIDTRTEAVISFANLGKIYGDAVMDADGDRIFIAGGGAIKNDRDFSKRLAARNEVAVSDDFNPSVLRGVVLHDRLSMESPILLRLDAKSRYVTGVARGADGALFAININTDTVYRLSSPDFSVQASAPAGYGAYRAAVSADGTTLAVSNWGDQSVTLFSSHTLHQLARISVGIHPNDLVFGRDARLFVANAGSNSISIIDGKHVTETVKTSFHSADPVGSTPDALALDPAEKRLYVANADNNDVAVIDIAKRGHSEVEGFIPTGWYPSAIAVSRDGKKLYVGVAKGLRSRANADAPPSQSPAKANRRNSFEFVGETLSGYVSVIPIPNGEQLERYTRRVANNFPDPEPQDQKLAREIRTHVFPEIQHVLYVIRENRTYDQVLGDLEKGNGDPSLTLFGEKVTPNAHDIARRWAVLDNLFVNGEVSENGHQWSDAAYATQFTSQAWLQSYSGRPEPKATESELGADERLRSSPGGYLWDNCARHGRTFRTYGEFAYFHSGPGEGPRFVAKGLDGHASVEWLKVASAGWTDITKGRDPDLAAVFIQELRGAEKSGTWPQFMVMSLGEDHTHALRAGHYTPSAMVASNDQALGAIVDAVSHSLFWPHTAIFVIEDDAQDGPDHVDCRRTEGFVISPYGARHIVDSTPYTTASMIHTMELILRLPPMTQFDRGAAPMYALFTKHPDFTPYTNVPPQIDLFAKNPSTGQGAEASAKLDLSAFDKADPQQMNQILWHALKPGLPMPAIVRSAQAMLGNTNAFADR